MNSQLKYMPIFRGRQEEIKVLKSFDFEGRIYPCIEIIKEIDRLPPKRKKPAKNPSKPKPAKQFEDVYLPLIRSIKAEKVFIDLPVHLKGTRSMKPETLNFLQSVVSKMDKRTEYMIKLASESSKIIPVISTYYTSTGERNTITTQESALRPHFTSLAFRTFPDSFIRDIPQIETAIQAQDCVIIDWQDDELDLNNDDQLDIIDRLKTLACTVIVHRNALPKELTNVSLIHDEVVDTVSNDLIDVYRDFAGSCFSDYAGIKKDNIGDGGVISPGFVYYDATQNKFYGYRYEFGSHKKGEVQPQLAEFETKIVPDVIASGASQRMHQHALDYLGTANEGWTIINRINQRLESGQNAGKFKRIGMEHYLHCIRTRILNGDFD